MTDPRPATPDRRPSFAKSFPRVASLDAVVDAFTRGDYARVRVEGRRLARSEIEPAEVRRCAETLVARTDPDPLAVWLLAISGALLVALAAYWVAHGAPPPVRAPAPPPTASTP
ncbi:MAG TPA: hypothetical protein VMI75_26645 [Polyangiaceae bacterium]|nr:hypothetical protein [Polyangiaceae bacterium]